MNIIDQAILSIGKRKLKSFRLKNKIPTDGEFAIYPKYLPTIRNSYSNTGYWHGTGRYQYKRDRNSRYGKINHSEHFDILESLIEKGGVTPHFDPHIAVQGEFIETISVTPFRMYARIYADMHLYEKNTLLYEYGSSKFWFNVFFIIQLFYKKYIPYLLTVSLRKLMSKSLYKQASQWIGVLRSDIGEKPVSLLKSMSVRSDIRTNYPILIGIKRDVLRPVLMPQRYERLETRIDVLISIDDMTHIEVPLSNIAETKECLKSHSINLRVIPLEFGEIYANNYSFKELTRHEKQ
ncbi:MAG: hypothetical protein ACI9P5_004687 [Saprospiraceae bacterium]|jgi:hypothetical protein